MPSMTIVLAVLGVSFVAFAIWLTVRIFNRRERWAKRTAVGVPLLMSVMYPIIYVLLMDPIWTIPYFGADWERYPIYRLHAPGDELVTTLFTPAH